MYPAVVPSPTCAVVAVRACAYTGWGLSGSLALSLLHVGVPSVPIFRICPLPVQSRDLVPPSVDAAGFGSLAAGSVPDDRSDALPLVATAAGAVPLICVALITPDPAAAIVHPVPHVIVAVVLDPDVIAEKAAVPAPLLVPHVNE